MVVARRRSPARCVVTPQAFRAAAWRWINDARLDALAKLEVRVLRGQATEAEHAVYLRERAWCEAANETERA